MIAPADLEVRNNADLHRFEIDLGDSVALATYNLLSHAILFPHTEVPRQHEGKGIGTLLVRTALDYARAEQLRVIPACPFFARYMKAHEEVQDLLDPAYRKVLGLDG